MLKADDGVIRIADHGHVTASTPQTRHSPSHRSTFAVQLRAPWRRQRTSRVLWRAVLDLQTPQSSPVISLRRRPPAKPIQQDGAVAQAAQTVVEGRDHASFGRFQFRSTNFAIEA
jgi:hypothetical protein